MAKQKLTRKSYKRNIIVFGFMIFMGIALVSTGFATWVLSQDTTVTSSGNVEVGIVSDEAMVIENVTIEQRNHLYSEFGKETFDSWVASSATYDKENKTISGFNFMFEPLKGDNEGMVKYQTPTEENPADKFEQMSLKISGTIASGFQHIQKMNVSFNIPTEGSAPYKNAITGLVAAANQGFITLPQGLFEYKEDEYTGNLNTLTLSQLTEENADASGYYYVDAAGALTKDASSAVSMKFQVVIEFGWGSKFKNSGDEDSYNPSVYYDEMYNGTLSENDLYNTILGNLKDLRSYIYTGTNNKYDETVEASADSLKYAILIDITTTE